MPATRRSYAKPPIREAIVELRFQPADAEWDPTIPARLHQVAPISTVYAGRPKIIPTNVAPPGLPADMGGAERTRFSSSDERRLLTVGPNVMSVNDLSPYTGWDSFRKRVDAALTAYRNVAPSSALLRVGVRYVNLIEIPGDEVQLSDYILCAPSTPEGLPQTFGAFYSRVKYQYPSGDTLVLTHGSAKSDPGVAAVLVDFDLACEFADSPLSPDDAMAVVDRLHESEGFAFESVITDRARALFDVI